MFLSPSPLPIENLVRLYGLHEKFVNNLASRYDEELIPCLLEHINTPACQVEISLFWTFGNFQFQAINHDRFKLLVAEFDELISLTADDIKPGIQEVLQENYTSKVFL